MKSSLIIRLRSGDQGTEGVWMFPGGLLLRTIELPWRDNRTDMSCIPAGEYDVVPYTSKRHGKCYRIMDVPGRTDVLSHVANFAGDSLKGLRTDVLGCVGVGMKTGVLGGQRAILASRIAMNKMRLCVGKESMKLRIVDSYSVKEL